MLQGHVTRKRYKKVNWLQNSVRPSLALGALWGLNRPIDRSTDQPMHSWQFFVDKFMSVRPEVAYTPIPPLCPFLFVEKG